MHLMWRGALSIATRSLGGGEFPQGRGGGSGGGEGGGRGGLLIRGEGSAPVRARDIFGKRKGVDKAFGAGGAGSFYVSWQNGESYGQRRKGGAGRGGGGERPDQLTSKNKDVKRKDLTYPKAHHDGMARFGGNSEFSQINFIRRSLPLFRCRASSYRGDQRLRNLGGVAVNSRKGRPAELHLNYFRIQKGPTSAFSDKWTKALRERRCQNGMCCWGSVDRQKVLVLAIRRGHQMYSKGLAFQKKMQTISKTCHEEKRAEVGRRKSIADGRV